MEIMYNNIVTKFNLKLFVIDYLHTASWLTCDSNDNTEFTREAKKLATADCEKFIEEVKKEFGEEKGMQLLSIPGNELGYAAAHDFWLTRNHHGAGFWDRPEKYGKEESMKLTDIAHKMGSAEVYHIRGKKSKLTF